MASFINDVIVKIEGKERHNKIVEEVVRRLVENYSYVKLEKCYKLKTLELIKRKNLVLELTQENSIENSIQDSLPYILNPHDLC